MRFESLMWSILFLLLAGVVRWDDGSAKPVPDGGQYEATDGCSTIPPPPKCV